MKLPNNILKGCEFHPEIDLSSYTTMRLKSTGNLLVVHDLKALKNVVVYLNENSIHYEILGWGANQLIGKNANEMIYLKLDLPWDEKIFEEIHESYQLPASVPLNKLTAHAVKFGLMGWEVFTGIPATLGGAIYMNAGTKFGEIGDIVQSVEVMGVDGEIRTINKDLDMFYYRGNNFVSRGEIIVGANLEHKGIDKKIPSLIEKYMKYRKETQPLKSKNCGCVFKNFKDVGAGELIELLGLKGYEYHGLVVSEIHANFIENRGKATLEDFDQLVQNIKFLVEIYSGRKIECEVKYDYNGKHEIKT
ncbi:MAG: FAD-binding protein [Halobacteriovoraceae bacterium]|nr:FAD-binding protein [Halobacteriovoraceae bacterium]